MAGTVAVQENSSVLLPNNQNLDSNKNVLDQTSQPTAECTSISNENVESIKTSSHTSTDHSIHDNSFNDMTNGMSGLSMHTMSSMNRSNSTRFRPHSNYPHHQTCSPAYLPSSMNLSDAQAQLVAFTPPLMSIQFPYQESHIRQRNCYPSRSYIPHHSNEHSCLSVKTKSETAVSLPEYYVDNFASNFSDKPSSNNLNKPKTKHVTFQEPDITNELPKHPSNNMTFSPPSSSSSNSSNYSASTWASPVPIYTPSHQFHRYNYPNQYYPYNDFYSYHSGMMANPQYTARPRRMNTMSTASAWPPRLYNPDQKAPYVSHSFQHKQLYDPNKPKTPSISESHNSSKVIRSIVPKNKKKTKQTNNDDISPVSTPESVPHPITILRKPSTDTEVSTPPISTISQTIEDQPVFLPVDEQSISTSVENHSAIPSENEQIAIPPINDQSISQSELNTMASITSHQILSILQSANCISSVNEFAQQNKFTLNYEFSSTSPSLFTCIVTMNGRQFPVSSACSSKNEAQKLACDQALRILYRELCTTEQSVPDFSNKHDYIAYQSLSKFQDLNVNELLLGRKTLACILMVTNGQFEQACVISISTGNTCLNETNLNYATDGTALHDCHAEILARRGLIRFLFEQIKQSKDNQSSIFQYNSTMKKYELHENITFHMYISSLPCGNASLKNSPNSIRYKQGQIEGTVLALTSSIKYPIKSCSDKICRWNILGIQGGLLINLLMKPIYLQTITLACETTFDRNHVKYSLCERLNEHFHSLPSPFLFHQPDIDCPKTKSFQHERQVAKLQTNAFAWNITQSDRTELLEPMTGKLKTDRSISSISKQNLFKDFTNFIQTNSSNDDSLSYTTYQQAKQLNKTYVTVKNLISTAFQTRSSDTNIPWLSKSDQLEQFSIQ